MISIAPLVATIPLRQVIAVLIAILCLIFSYILDNNIFTSIMIIFSGAIIVISYNNKMFSDPIAVFTLFFIPYSTWYNFYYVISGINLGDQFERSLSEALNLSLLGLVSYASSGAIFRIIFKRRACISPAPKPINIFQVGIILICCGLIWKAILDVILLNLASKREIISMGLSSVSLANFAAFVVAAGALLVGWRLQLRHGILRLLFSPLTIISCITLFAMMIVLGERDAIFRFVFSFFVIYFVMTRRANMGVILIIFLVTLMLVPLTQSAKAIVIGGGPPSALNADLLFSGEFISALRNTQRIIFYGTEHSMSFILNDVLRALSPLFPLEGVMSTAAWYNNVFRSEHGFSGASGWGLGFVAQGYLVAGPFGVVGLLSLVAIVMHLLYYQSLKSDLWLIFYAFSLATAIYCIRADLAGFLSQTFKVGGTALVIFALTRRLGAVVLVEFKGRSSAVGGSHEGKRPL